MPELLHFRDFPPDKPALIIGMRGETVTFGDLEAKANQGAHLLRAAGLASGDVIGICIRNSAGFLFVATAARRCGLTVVPISTKLTAPEVVFIVGDSGARALVVSPGIDASPGDLMKLCSGVQMLSVGGAVDGARAWEEAFTEFPPSPLPDESPGGEMLYSSGTTGRPKGIRYHGAADATASAMAMLGQLGVGHDSVYLSPAPLYHSAPFAWALAMLGIGATVVVMERFDAEDALTLIARHRIDVSQWVPTHFVRMLKLPDDVRAKYDVSSLRLAVHAAAPCPVPIKRAMIEWWGPILLEYFGSSEQTALTIITSREWLEHPGSVGRCVRGKLHICDEDGEPLPAGETGLVYSEGGTVFSYHGDEAKTREAHNAKGWTTVGDVGHLDEDGYLYLTDRKSFMIISGGVNIYPQEIENMLVTHPAIIDAAVMGAPDDDLGEAVTAVVQLADVSDATEAFTDELLRWLRGSLSGVKVPKHVLYREDLPRLPTGKMAKHMLREEVEAELRQTGRHRA